MEPVLNSLNTMHEGGIASPFLTSTLLVGERSASYRSRLTPEKSDSGVH
jgi:hypothetical protein